MSILPYYVLLYKFCPLNGQVPEPPLQFIVIYDLLADILMRYLTVLLEYINLFSMILHFKDISIKS